MKEQDFEMENKPSQSKTKTISKLRCSLRDEWVHKTMPYSFCLAHS
jgi:hypothetical protein